MSQKPKEYLQIIPKTNLLQEHNHYPNDTPIRNKRQEGEGGRGAEAQGETETKAEAARQGKGEQNLRYPCTSQIAAMANLDVPTLSEIGRD